MTLTSEERTTPTESDGQPLLEARGVIMRFGGLVAVNNVDLTVNQGEIVGLIGPNGAGKTTFFNCLTGMYKPTEGSVRLAGADLPPKPRAVVTAGMARTFQNIRLFGNMTALENVMVGRYCRTSAGASPRSCAGRSSAGRSRPRGSVPRSCSTSSARKSTELLARNMPYGDQRRLEVARALATDPKLILLDEPTAGMNPQETRQASDLIFKIRDNGLAVVVIEHDMRFIFNLCDRVLCLVRGETLVEGTPEQVQSDPRVIEAYIGEPESEEEEAQG